MIKSNYDIVENDPNKPLIIRDVGPWDIYKSVTNDAERVVEELYNMGLLDNNRQLLYYDSDGQLDELKHEGRDFTGFAPWPRR